MAPLLLDKYKALGAAGSISTPRAAEPFRELHRCSQENNFLKICFFEECSPLTTYPVEGRTVDTSSEIHSDVMQVYRVSWRNAKIVSLEFLGPKKEL